MSFTLRQLEYLVSLEQSLSFRRAAAACHVTQPGLSTQIQQLERALGTPMFERTRRSVAVTAAGQRVAVRARHILAEVTALEDEAKALGKPLSGTLRLGVIPTVAPYVLPKFVPALRRQHSSLRLLICEDHTDVLLQNLTEAKLDVLLLALEADLHGAETRALYDDPFVLAAPQGHPMATGGAIRAHDLVGQELLLLEDGHCLRDQALDICNMRGARETTDFRASSLNTLIRMVAAGTGITLLPAMSLATEIRPRDKIVTRGFSKRGPSRTIGLAWRKSSPRVAEFDLLADLLRDRAPVSARSS